MSLLISIIVPVYNAEKFISKTIISVLNQTYKNFELILVDDGSTDKSQLICSNFEKQDNRIKLITKNNSGAEQTRKLGILNSNGVYIIHVDADDFLPINSVQILYDNIEKYNADVVIGNSRRFIDKFFIFSNVNMHKMNNLILDNETFNKNYLHSFFGQPIFSVALWGKIYKKSTLEKIEIKNSGFGLHEDIYYNLQVFPKLKKIIFIEDIVYNYRFGGVTQTLNLKMLPEAIELYIIRLNLLIEIGRNDLVEGLTKEMISYFKSFINMLIIFNHDYSIEEELDKILKLDNFKIIKKNLVKYDFNTKDKELIKFILENNIQKIIAVGCVNKKQKKIVHNFKIFIFYFFNKFI